MRGKILSLNMRNSLVTLNYFLCMEYSGKQCILLGWGIIMQLYWRSFDFSIGTNGDGQNLMQLYTHTISSVKNSIPFNITVFCLGLFLRLHAFLIKKLCLIRSRRTHSGIPVASIPSTNDFFLNSYYTPDTMLSAGDIKVYRMIPDYRSYTVQWERETVRQQTLIQDLKVDSSYRM